MTENKGQLVTRLLGRLKVLHGSGVIEFEIRNPKEIEKRGARIIFRVEGLGEIPFLSEGTTIQVDANEGAARFVKSEEIHPDR